MPRKPEDLLEATMGLVSNAHDWGMPRPHNNCRESVEWRGAARRWLDEYQTWLKQYLLEENSKMPNIKIDVDPEIREKLEVALNVATKGVELWHQTLERFRSSDAGKQEAYEEGYRAALNDVEAKRNISSRRIVQTDNGWEYTDADMASEEPTMRPDSDISPDQWDAMELAAARHVEQAQKALAHTLQEQREVQKRRWSARVR